MLKKVTKELLFLNKKTIYATLTLTIFAFFSCGILIITHYIVSDKIKAQSINATLQQFHEIAPFEIFDENLIQNARNFVLNNKMITLYSSKNIDFIKTETNKGYGGKIVLLIGIAKDGKTLLGVRTISHKETPGLGDKIDIKISNWIESFNGKNLDNSVFAISKDGGDFDAFTGASITPRAVVNLVGETLRAWNQYKSKIQ